MPINVHLQLNPGEKKTVIHARVSLLLEEPPSEKSNRALNEGNKKVEETIRGTLRKHRYATEPPHEQYLPKGKLTPFAIRNYPVNEGKAKNPLPYGDIKLQLSPNELKYNLYLGSTWEAKLLMKKLKAALEKNGFQVNTRQ